MLGVTEAAALTLDAVEAGKTAGLLAAAALKASLAQARTIHVEALSPVGTVTALLAVLPVPPHRAPLPALLSGEAGRTPALPPQGITATPVVAAALPLAAGAEAPGGARYGADVPHPSMGADAGAGAGGVADTPILAGAVGAARCPLGAQHLTEWASKSWGAEAGTSGGVAGGPVVAWAVQAAVGAVGAGRAGLVAQWGGEARGAGTDPTQGIAGGPVVAVTVVLAVLAPQTLITRAGAVVSPPARLTLATLRGHAPPVDALLGAARDAGVPALIVAQAALVAPAVVGAHRLSVLRAVHDPLLRAGLWQSWCPSAGLGGSHNVGFGV